MQHDYENPRFGVPRGFFSQKISPKSVTNTVKDFNKSFSLWKSGTKGRGPQVRMLAQYCWTLNRGICEAKERRKSYSSIFRCKYLHVSLVRKVLIFTERVICIFETLLD